jgi:transcriptional regulator with XRE-family HTH domain
MSNSMLPKGRTIPINGDAVRTIRIKRKLNIDELANLAACSVKTIENIEKGGKRVYATTFDNIASALGIADYLRLMDESAGSPLSALRRRRIYVTFTMEVDFDEFDETEEIQECMEKIRQAAGMTREIGIMSIKEENSVDVTAEMSEADTLRFVRAFCSEKLDILHVSRIKIHDNMGCHVWEYLYPRIDEDDEAFHRFLEERVGWRNFKRIYNRAFARRLRNILRKRHRSKMHVWELDRRIKLAIKIMYEIFKGMYHNRALKITFDGDGSIIVSRYGEKGSMIEA